MSLGFLIQVCIGETKELESEARACCRTGGYCMGFTLNNAFGKSGVSWSRIIFLFLGIVLFALIYYWSPWPDAVDPMGKHFALTREGKGALAVFLLAVTWWAFETVPIGVTSLTIGVLQAIFLIRPAQEAFKDFMDPSVIFIFASILNGMVLIRTGLAKRLAYSMLKIAGERTSMIYLGCFVVTAFLTHFMIHTAVAATVYPLYLAIYSLYGDKRNPTKFGKGLFIGMAYICGAGSIITLLGSARGPIAISFLTTFTGKDISFFELTYYLAPLGWLMVFLLWGYFMLVLKPEKEILPGLGEKLSQLSADLGPFKKKELLAAGIIVVIVLVLFLQSIIPTIHAVSKTAIILISTVLFFVFKILDIQDLEEIPWNIILLFSGAVSIGFCLWETGAAPWLAVKLIVLFQKTAWLIFVLGLALFVMIMINLIMNVAVIAISLPVALAIAPYLHIAPEVVFFTSLTAAGMPLMLLAGSAPNAIAYDSRQFTGREFLLYGIPASILLMLVVVLFVYLIWPMMGLPIFLAQ
jgi:solute carrier family 13 (sodium-dependent dicarboxylate transporter), member 2/3/5